MTDRTKDGIEVLPRQVWRDLDKRMHGRKIVIEFVADGYAHYHGPQKNKIAIRRLRRPFWELCGAMP